MAVLKHIAIKNADYSAAVCYLKYQHDERHLKPLLDENGNMMLRSEFHMNGVNCNPDTFDLECEMLNDQYRKNYRYDFVSLLSLIGGWGGVFLPHFGQKKSRRPFSDFLLGVPLCGRRVFSCKSSGQVDPMCGWQIESFLLYTS